VGYFALSLPLHSRLHVNNVIYASQLCTPQRTTATQTPFGALRHACTVTLQTLKKEADFQSFFILIKPDPDSDHVTSSRGCLWVDPFIVKL